MSPARPRLVTPRLLRPRLIKLRPVKLRPAKLRDWTLRTRLVASFLGLLVLVCVGIGVCTDLAVKSSLNRQLDRQLSHAGGLAGGGVGGQGGGFTPPGGDQRLRTLPPSSPIDSVGATITNGTVTTSALQDGNTNRPPLTTAVQAALLKVPTDNRPRTVTLPGLGSYRVVARADGANAVSVIGFSLSDTNSTLRNLTLVITGLSALGLLIAALVGALIVRLALRPLRRVTATATRVAEMSLDEGEVVLAERVPEPNPNTEIGQVGVALNRMLENVNDALNARHESETRVRQFVADASHELRTPLASIRGYAELTRRSRDVAPPDIAHAMSRVESEAGRMTTLVEDLLLLARLDAGRPLDSAEVDLTRLAVDAIGDAHAAGPQHRWHLDVPDEPVLVTGDAPRLQQVLVNILANARTHTPAGTNVWVSLAQQGQTVQLRVRDDGPGIPPALMPDIFERFSRGEESRSRTAGSTGLGLAIVSAVVGAHHGTITVDSAPGSTTFTVSLPIHGVRPGVPQSTASFAGQGIAL